MKPRKPGTKREVARITMRLPQSLWDQVQHRAIDEHIQLQELVARALEGYLKQPKGGRP